MKEVIWNEESNLDLDFHGPVGVWVSSPSKSQRIRMSLTSSVTLDGATLANYNPLLEFYGSSLGFPWEVAVAYLGASQAKRTLTIMSHLDGPAPMEHWLPPLMVLWETCVFWSWLAALLSQLCPTEKAVFTTGEQCPTTVTFKPH